MQLRITCTLAYPVEHIWAEVQTSRLMLTVIKPMVQFMPVNPPILPEIWTPGAYCGRMRLFGFIPFGEHTIRISFPEAQQEGTYQMRDNGGGQVIARWDHLITVRKLNAGRTFYEDSIEIRAGILTLFVWLYAHVYYRYRQWRWRHLVAAHFDYSRF